MTEETQPETTNVLKYCLKPEDVPSKEETAKLDNLAEICGQIRIMVCAWLKTPIMFRDRHVFAEQIRKLGHEVLNWADDWEAR